MNFLNVMSQVFGLLSNTYDYAVLPHSSKGRRAEVEHEVSCNGQESKNVPETSILGRPY